MPISPKPWPTSIAPPLTPSRPAASSSSKPYTMYGPAIVSLVFSSPGNLEPYILYRVRSARRVPGWKLHSSRGGPGDRHLSPVRILVFRCRRQTTKGDGLSHRVARRGHTRAPQGRRGKKPRPPAGVDRLKPVPPMHANDWPVVGQALSPANCIICHLLTVAARIGGEGPIRAAA